MPFWPLPAPQAALLAVSSSRGLKALDCIVGSLGHQSQETESFGHFCPMLGYGRAKQVFFLQLVFAAWGSLEVYSAKWFRVVLTLHRTVDSGCEMLGYLQSVL